MSTVVLCVALLLRLRAVCSASGYLGSGRAEALCASAHLPTMQEALVLPGKERFDVHFFQLKFLRLEAIAIGLEAIAIRLEVKQKKGRQLEKWRRPKTTRNSRRHCKAGHPSKRPAQRETAGDKRSTTSKITRSKG